MNPLRCRCPSLLSSELSVFRTFSRGLKNLVKFETDPIKPDYRTKEEIRNPKPRTIDNFGHKPVVPIDQASLKISQQVALDGLQPGSGMNFGSVYSLQKLYPDSVYNFSNADDAKMKDAAANSEKFHGYIPMDHLKVTVCRSSGPGGQNVNKVNTKVEVRFKIADAWWIPEKLRDLLMEKHKTKITKEGYFYVDSEKTRKQSYNLADCLDKIRFIVRELENPPKVPREEDPEVVQARIRRAASERLREKRDQSLKKQSRQADMSL